MFNPVWSAKNRDLFTKHCKLLNVEGICLTILGHPIMCICWSRPDCWFFHVRCHFYFFHIKLHTFSFNLSDCPKYCPGYEDRFFCYLTFMWHLNIILVCIIPNTLLLHTVYKTWLHIFFFTCAAQMLCRPQVYLCACRVKKKEKGFTVPFTMRG